MHGLPNKSVPIQIAFIDEVRRRVQDMDIAN